MAVVRFLTTLVALVAGGVTVVPKVLPVDVVLPKRYVEMYHESAAYKDKFDLTEIYRDDVVYMDVSEIGFPVYVRPVSNATNSFAALQGWLKAGHRKDVYDLMYKHGGVVIRGWAIYEPAEFESISLTMEPNLASTYLGTSPRNVVPGLKFTHTASEIPGLSTVPAHCEMSFKLNPPKTQFFFAALPNEGLGGETNAVDFQAVAETMDKGVLKRLETLKIRYVRKYFDATLTERTNRTNWDEIDFYKTKSWQAMFATYSKEEATVKAEEEGFTVTWQGGDRNVMKLTHEMPALRTHKVTGATVFHNHIGVIEATSHKAEYAFAALHQKSWKFAAMHHIMGLYHALSSYFIGEDELGLCATYGNGEPIPQEDIDHIRGQIWKHTLIRKHKLGDIILLDNMRVGHGRQPFSGPRKILTTWAD